MNALAALFGLVLFAYLWLDTWYLLAALLVIAGVGVDQVLRMHPSTPFQGPLGTAIYLFVPVLFALGSALFLREIASGVWVLVLSVVAAGLFAACTHAEYLTVQAEAGTYAQARFALSVISYLTAFALFTVISTGGYALPAATLLVAVVVALLTVDLLRELDVRNAALFGYAGTVAVVLAEVRWAIYYLALGRLLAGGLLLIVFYVITGLVQSFLSGHLDRRTLGEFAVVGTVGSLIIAAFTAYSRNA